MRKGLKILFETYWSSSGWKSGEISKSDFEIARKEGYMFDYPSYETHSQALERLEKLLSIIDAKDVANAFLYSLSTRSLEYRSALGSYYYAKAIPKHEIDSGYHSIKTHCYLCGWSAWEKAPTEYDLKNGLNVFNFERYKFGGVRHTKLDYAIFDLEQFLKLPKVTPTLEDQEILKNILECIYKLDDNSKIGKLRDLISKEKLFKSNKAEIRSLLEELGICGVLASKDYPCYEDKFVDEYLRSAVEHKNDFSYPINRWKAKDGINKDRFEKVFGYKIY